MRISTPAFYNRNTESITTKQNKLSDQNVHLSSQKRVIHGSDDAVAIATIHRLKQKLSIDDQYIHNGQMAETANGLEETSLAQSTNILQRFREILVTAGNDTLNEENRKAMTKELTALRGELIGVSNTRDGNSQYIFSGFEVDTQPFQRNEFGNIDYHGDDGHRLYKVGSGVTVQGDDSGRSVFVDIPEGNGTFVSEGSANNKGSGVIDEAAVIDSKKANGFLSQDYTVAISEKVNSKDTEYSVYGLKKISGSGEAKVRVSGIDLKDNLIATVNPANTSPDKNSSVDIEFMPTDVENQFEIRINGQSSLPKIYDATNTTTQQIDINGISLEIDGVPSKDDRYTFEKYIEPTLYQEGQSIEFNGIKTSLKGQVKEHDNFTLRQSERKDVFATMQDSIDALLIPDDDDFSKSQREMRLDMSRHQIDNTLKNITRIRTSVGARMRTIDNQRESSQDFKLTSQTTLSNLEDLDMAAAISDFSKQKSLLDVSQKTFVKMQDLSLFKLI